MTPEAVLAMWQELNSHWLSVERRAEFLARPEVAELCECEPMLLRKTGEHVLRKRGELRLSVWLRSVPEVRRLMPDVGRRRVYMDGHGGTKSDPTPEPGGIRG